MQAGFLRDLLNEFGDHPDLSEKPQHKADKLIAAVTFSLDKGQVDPSDLTAFFAFDTVIDKHQKSRFSA